jgi:SAM-dependent methyltransferase
VATPKIPLILTESKFNRLIGAALSEHQAAASKQTTRQLLMLRASIAAMIRRSMPEPPSIGAMVAPVEIPVAGVLEWMRARSPAAFEAWRQAFEEARLGYKSPDLRANSLSVASNPGAEGFAVWARTWLHGRVLDIGCGPQAVPVYLETHPSELCAGIDPLPPFDCHPFVFREAFCESIPWPDASFEVVTCATSLDHVFDLDRSLDEIRRVLVPGGVFLLWVAFVDEAAPYDVDRVTTRLDRFHLFHFDRPWFYPLMLRRFEILEDWAFDGQSHFICLRPTSGRH